MSLEELRTELEALKVQNAALQAQQNQPSTSDTLTSDTTAPTKGICGVTVKLPPFWADRPAVWFAQAEAQFHLAGIKADMTKFSHVISIIDQRLIGEIEDIIMSPPEHDKYKILKEELIRRLSVSEQQRVERLLSSEELGTRKPSAFLRHLQSLAGSSKDDSILRQLWMRRLPGQVQAILTAQSDISLDKLAELADKIMEVTPGPQQACQVTNNSGQPDLNAVMARLEQLTQQVAAMTTRGQRGRSRNRSSSRSRSRTNSPASGATRLCWYHKKFNTRATKCNPPCNWNNSENSNSGQ
ncbi:uncharacterized protein LOC134670973 [Cydia fagiglandana]|uniref:uncharacterized protein LOC134670973 n=1 Tax=Cydia fagiglandana TaxID=1458189 RepID=UPI002FEE40A1